MEDIKITTNDIAQWEADEQRLVRTIADATVELEEVRKRLAAAALLRSVKGKSVAKPVQESFQITATARSHIPAPPGPKTMIEWIEDIATNSAQPITKTEVSRMLKSKGFDNANGAYFYTAIQRLSNKKRILVMNDGRLWRPSPQ